MTDISLRYLLFGEDKGATSTISRVGGAFSKVGAQVGGEFGEILNKVGEGIDHIGEHAHSMGAKLTAVGGIAAGVGIAFQLAGSKEAAGAAQLNAAIDATGAAHEDYEKSVEGAIKANEKFGFGAADTQQALAKLTAATNSPEQALKLMGTTANLAASQHISLADAAKMVARVTSGTGGKVLAQYGIQMDHTKTKTQAGAIALDQLAKKLKGQAPAAVDSFGGKIRVLQTKIGDWTAQMGQKLGPALTIAGPLIMAAGTVVEIYTARQAAAALATEAETVTQEQSTIAKVAGAIATGAIAAATGVWTAAQWLLNAALTANPIGLVIAGIAALVVAFIIAWKHSEKFRDIVKGAMHAVVVAASVVGNWFKGIAKWIGDHLRGVGSAITKPFTAAFGIIMTGIHVIEDAWNAVTGALGGGGPKPSSLPQSPANRAGLRGHAAGGIFTRPTVGLIGEAGPEALIPLAAGRGQKLLGGGGDTYNITVNGALDPIAVGKQVEQVLAKLRRTNGGRTLAFQ